MSVERAAYLDSSAIVKLVVREPETKALQRDLQRRPTLVSSALARAEVLRATMGHGAQTRRTAEGVLNRLELLRVDDRVLRAAGELEPTGLRTLDAIHLASALALGDSLTQMVCYDVGLAGAARRAGLSVAAPC